MVVAKLGLRGTHTPVLPVWHKGRVRLDRAGATGGCAFGNAVPLRKKKKEPHVGRLSCEHVLVAMGDAGGTKIGDDDEQP